MRDDLVLELSDNDGIYGEVSTNDGALQVLISEPEDSGIRVIPGGRSRFRFFLFVPRIVYDQLVEAYDEAAFQQTLLHVSELLLRPDDGNINE